jgi:hypothetical protein
MPTSFPADDIKHQVIYALLNEISVSTLAGTRVFPNQIPGDLYSGSLTVVVSLIDGRGEETLNGYTGQRTSTVQVDSYGENSIEVNELSKRCKLRLINHGGAFGDATIKRSKIINELDLPAELPIDKSDRWRFRRSLRCEIDYCEDLI